MSNIAKGNSAVTAINYIKNGTERAITAIYKGTKLIWEIVSSCFGNGYWINSQKWSNTDGWKNNINKN